MKSKKVFTKADFKVHQNTVSDISRSGNERTLYYSGGLLTKMLTILRLRPPYRPCLTVDTQNKEVSIVKFFIFRDNSIVWPIGKIEVIKGNERSVTITHIDSRISKTIKRIVDRDRFCVQIEALKKPT